MYLEELYQVQQVQVVSWCAGDQHVIYPVLQVLQEGIMENGSLILMYILSDIHTYPHPPTPTPPKRFLIIHNGITCFHLFAIFSLPSIFSTL